jgi:15-cis-phytoene synthase
MNNVTLNQSYRWCQQVARRSHSSFYRSFALLRPEKEQAMSALYAFARIVDDEGDSGLNSRSSEILKSWHEWLDSLQCETIAAQTVEQRAIRPAFADMVSRYSMPMTWFHELLSGIESDLAQGDKKATWNDLEHYCYCVAGTVGMACVRIWGGDSTVVAESAKCCGLAFQLTNILRDVREDAVKGRIYFPEEDLAAYGVSRSAWLSLKPDGDWQGLLRSYVERTEANYQAGYQVGFSIAPDSQRMFSLIWKTYRRLLDEIRSELPNLFQRRVCLSSLTKFRLAATHFVTPLYVIDAPFQRTTSSAVKS